MRFASLILCCTGLAACASPRYAESDGPEDYSEIVYEDLPPAGPPRPAPTKDAPITIAAVGDIMLGSTYPYVDGRDLPPADERPAGLMTPFAPFLQGADLAFGNLEGAVVAADNALAKPKCVATVKGCFAFRMPPELAPQLVAAGFDFLSMANNHVLDFGEAGRTATRATLDGLGLRYSGQRGDIARAVVRGTRVSMIALSNYDYAYNLNDLADATAAIKAEAAQCDVLIVSFHGGAEGPDKMHVPVGAEYFLGRNRGDLRVFARAAVDAGADLVLGHGPHVVRGIELYRERLIAYSLANFSTYKRFNLTGVNGLAYLLDVSLARDGRFLAGRAHALRQLGLGGPEPDPERAVLTHLRKLSREDFPETGVDIGPLGEISAFGTRPSIPIEEVAPPSPPLTTAPGAKHLADLHPHLRALALELHRRAVIAGIPFRIVFGYTPYKPRSKPGLGGMATWHQFGLAFDILIADRKDIDDGRRHFEDDNPAWQRLGAIAQELGLVWGGIWKRNYDPFHFEWHPGDDSTISQKDLARFLALAGPNGSNYRDTWVLYPTPSR